MGENLKKLYYQASNLKNIILEDNNIDILLYLAKYNPKVTKSEIAAKIGGGTAKGLKDLEKCNLIKEESDNIILTDEGIFQVEGLLTLNC